MLLHEITSERVKMLGYETQFWIMWAALIKAAGILIQCVLVYRCIRTMRRDIELENQQLMARERVREA